MLKIAKLSYFCHLKTLARPETFGPYYVPEDGLTYTPKHVVIICTMTIKSVSVASI